MKPTVVPTYYRPVGVSGKERLVQAAVEHHEPFALGQKQGKEALGDFSESCGISQLRLVPDFSKVEALLHPLERLSHLIS